MERDNLQEKEDRSAAADILKQTPCHPAVQSYQYNRIDTVNNEWLVWYPMIFRSISPINADLGEKPSCLVSMLVFDFP